MSYKVGEIVEFIEDWAKPDYQEEWDNSGWQIEFKDQDLNSVLIAMDLTDKLVDKAIEEKSNLIITHHPMFFDSIKNINSSDYKGRNIIKMIQNKISLYSAHTSMDIANGGVNHTICKFLGLEEGEGLEETSKGFYLGRFVKNKNNFSINDIYDKFSKLSDKNEVALYGRKKDKIEKIAICAGSGFSLFNSVLAKGADLFITGDVKHHQAQEAYENNICLMDIGHHNGEKLIIEEIKRKIESRFDIKLATYLNNDYKIK